MASGNRLKIAICGKSGLVGSKLEKYFTSQHNSVVDVNVRGAVSAENVAVQIEKCDVLINLSGATILAHWSDEYKKTLYDSRIDTTKKLVDAIALCKDRPKLFLNASAVGIYASNEVHDDDSTNYADDYLAHICKDWEAEARMATSSGVRNVQMRFGVVLAKEGGALQKMLPPFKFGLGGKVGSGEQRVSWIHIDDLVKAVQFIIKTPAISGSVNFCTPYPLSNIEQTEAIGRILHRPTIFPLPAFVLKLIFGEGAAVMLDSKEVYPSKLTKHGFVFEYEHFEDALKDIVS
ncbi:MAG: TIGR01777 family oxidoreductase [Sulfurimonas sp.]|nr:TIGR01777 family oxidoreductase [Sulfurimonas sp.]